MKKSFSVLLLLIMVLGGCSQMPEKLSHDQQAFQWQKQQQDAAKISSWYIDGRVGIKTSDSSGSASLFWEQQGTSYELRIVAPLGRGTYILSGSPAGVQMRGPDNLLLTATSPEELMQKGLGWSVDLEGLRYWVRGLPAPGSYQQLQLDGYGRMNALEQSGFYIDIASYVDVQELALPNKLEIQNNNLQLKVLIKHWEL